MHKKRFLSIYSIRLHEINEMIGQQQRILKEQEQVIHMNQALLKSQEESLRKNEKNHKRLVSRH